MVKKIIVKSLYKKGAALKKARMRAKPKEERQELSPDAQRVRDSFAYG